MDNKKLNDAELEQVTGGADDTIDIPGLEAIGSYPVASHRDMPAPTAGSYSEAERKPVPENTETVLR